MGAVIQAPDCPRDLEVIDLGLVSWKKALQTQMERVEAVAQGRAGPALFVLEHDPVITLGISGNMDNLRVPPEELRRRGIALEHARRGGDVTCHFPGQLVAYPVFSIERRPGGVKRLFQDLEQSLIDLLERFGIAAGRREGCPGVWIKGRKIASIGLGVRRWVTFHGLALNVGRDLELFSLVTPCGLAGVESTSLEREREAAGILPWRVDMQEVKDVFVEQFKRSVAPA